MRYGTVIFDFNGTLFWDTPLHDRAFDIFLEKHGIRLTPEEKKRKIHGKTNDDIFRGIFERDLTPAEIRVYAIEKETIYQGISRAAGLPLAPGAVEFFAFLKDRGVRYTIATSSGPENVEFYFDFLRLDRWFDRDAVAYNDGRLRGKPHPDLFIEAMKRLGAVPEETVVFEDSVSGIVAAEKAGIGKVFIVNSNDEDYSGWKHEIITDFGAVDSGLFS